MTSPPTIIINFNIKPSREGMPLIHCRRYHSTPTTFKMIEVNPVANNIKPIKV
ncbi:MAG: hypothetical protein KBF69_06785 [Saprospiraceae bacterium]|nr:hypothetical protein [Saprospiraceae bacterium]